MEILVKDAACGYTKNKPVQRNLNFSVHDGEICCLLGTNGCGKTTLFKSMLGLLPVLEGSILIDGKDVSGLGAAKLAESMAYVSQQHVPPFPYEVKDVVMLGRISRLGFGGTPGREDRRVVEQAMKDMDVWRLRDRPYTAISGGELQLVMIARAVAQEPKMLVLDEPTAALDYGNVVRVIDKVRELAQRGYGIVMTTHSPDHAFMCRSNVVLLQKDAPMKFGDCLDIITESNMREAYGIEVKIVEFTNAAGETMRLCSPVL